MAADSDPEVPDSESDSDSDGDSDDVADSESGTPAASDSEAQVTVDTEPVYRPRIFSFGSKDKGDRSDKAEKDKAEKAERAEKEQASKDRADKSDKADKADKADKDKADHQVPLADLPCVPMHLAVHHNEAEEVAEQLRASLRETLPGCVVISVVDVTHSMAVHTGPGAVGVSLVRD